MGTIIGLLLAGIALLALKLRMKKSLSKFSQRSGPKVNILPVLTTEADLQMTERTETMA
jgi:hypothetical protein